MKKLFFPMILVLVLASSLAFAKTYDLSTSSTLTSGNTTVANGGVSEFVLEGLAGSYDLYPQLNRYYALGFALSHVTPSQVALAAGNWSGVTYSVYGKFKSNDTTVPWSAVEPVYFIKNEAANSATSPYPRWIKVPPADLARIYFVSEGGNTVFGLAQAKLIASEIPLDVADSVCLIPASPVYYLTNTSSGVSTLTVPNGASTTYIRITGSDIRYTLDGTTPDANSSPILTQYQELTLESKSIAKGFKFRETSGGSGSTVYPRHTNERK